MPAQSAALNTDVNAIKTSSYYEDRGDGTSGWVIYDKVADGGDVAQGATDDSAVTNPASDASVIAALKGVLSLLGGTLDVSGDITTTPAEVTVGATTALATNLVVKASAGTLRGFAGYSTTAQFIQVHDASSLPADATVPELVFPIEADKPFSFSIPEGHACSTGIVICNSSTGPTKTIGSADTWITAYYE